MIWRFDAPWKWLASNSWTKMAVDLAFGYVSHPKKSRRSDQRNWSLDRFAIEWQDDREDYGEDRFVIIGMVSNRLLFVAYTMRGEAIRIISARGAEPPSMGIDWEVDRLAAVFRFFRVYAAARQAA